ncbi:unnamed protein product, partial [Anisakis simplex]|uniref:Uncharacterized protein n=1 Tax=Anisakis simplex TaxID=6269 RepID=A0A0M3KJX2_ANISI
MTQNIPQGYRSGPRGVFSNAGSPTKQQQQQQYNTTTTTSVVGNQSAANIVADPMRIANDNAPAPFIVPARGNKPSFRGKGIAFRLIT